MFHQLDLNYLDKKDAHRVHSERHSPKGDSELLNKASTEANRDRSFVTDTVDQLKGMPFPSYKNDMIEFMRQTSCPEKNISLVRTLTDGKLYQSLYQVKSALEQENPTAKQAAQMSDETRTGLLVTKTDSSHKRKDYTEVPATAQLSYDCLLCGKSFQSRDDLIHHQQFESEGEA
jgi:hypothetical protein